MNEERLFHLALPRELDVKYAILPGDPGRVDKIAAYLHAPEFLAFNREFKSVIGEIKNEKVLITSTGIGGPSAAIALEELSLVGVGNIIRIGTCGAMQENILPGDMILPSAAVRMEGTSKEYAPIEFPAVSDFEITSYLKKACEELKINYHIGVVQSKDSFYGQHAPESMPVSYELENKWQAWKKLGVLASEMETAALFTVSAARGIKAGCILHALWNQERAKKGLKDDSHFDMDMTIKAAVLAIEKMLGERS